MPALPRACERSLFFYLSTRRVNSRSFLSVSYCLGRSRRTMKTQHLLPRATTARLLTQWTSRPLPLPSHRVPRCNPLPRLENHSLPSCPLTSPDVRLGRPLPRPSRFKNPSPKYSTLLSRSASTAAKHLSMHSLKLNVFLAPRFQPISRLRPRLRRVLWRGTAAQRAMGRLSLPTRRLSDASLIVSDRRLCPWLV
jgi:hypothetical protein